MTNAVMLMKVIDRVTGINKINAVLLWIYVHRTQDVINDRNLTISAAIAEG